MTNQSHHFESLTWLRGLAAFLVIISHTLRATEQTYNSGDQVVDWLVLRIFDLGTFGVLLFFTLSGTTLFLSYSSHPKPPTVSAFYVKRFFRIWPAFAISLFIYFGFSYLFRYFYGTPSGQWVESQFMLAPSLLDFVSYLTLSFNISGNSGLFNNAYWSLPVEFQYYLLFPIMVLLIPYLKAFSPLMMGVALYLLYKLDLGVLEDNRMLMLGFTFCGGVLLGYLYKHTKLRFGWVFGTSAFLGLVGIASIIRNEFIQLPPLPVISNIWVMLGLISILVVGIAMFSDIRLPKRVTGKLFKYGEFSYSVYLYHNLFIGLAVLLLVNLNINDAIARYAVVFFLGGIVSSYVASLSYRFIELPFMKLGSSIAKRISA